MTRVAIIGAGVAGLSCAHFLNSRYDLTIFEQNDYAGGHTNTITVDEDGIPIPIDTGFMVYNEVTYPNLTRLFRELDVKTKPTTMSFSVGHQPSGIEYNGAGMNLLFGQRRNLVNPRFWRLLTQMNRFNGEASAALDNPAYATHTVRQYVDERGYGNDFLNLFLVPMSSAVWSTPPDRMLEFPAVTLLRFFHNHGFLGLHTHHPWRTLDGGAKSYVAKMSAGWSDRVALRSKAVKVTRSMDSVCITTADGTESRFDKVIMAAHAGESLTMLTDATPTEQYLLGQFQYQPNTTTLHTDASFMPKTKRCWASWNYRIDQDSDENPLPSTHYWMNSLQGVSQRRNYFVSLNCHDRIAPESVLRRIEYHHPVFSLGAIDAQKVLPSLNNISPLQTTYFCGSYFKYGFHEDAFTSGLECARAITGEPLWI